MDGHFSAFEEILSSSLRAVWETKVSVVNISHSHQVQPLLRATGRGDPCSWTLVYESFSPQGELVAFPGGWGTSRGHAESQAGPARLCSVGFSSTQSDSTVLQTGQESTCVSWGWPWSLGLNLYLWTSSLPWGLNPSSIKLQGPIELRGHIA